MNKSEKLSTFAGVFTPSILTILGIILFLRLGYIVGTAGLVMSLLVLLLANAISVLSSLSLAAISTNLEIKAGGIYYLISRTLGYEFGGAIGIVLFLAQAISIGFYCLGFAEILAPILPNTIPLGVQPLAALAILVLFVFAWLGSDWATRFQYLVMSILLLALISFFWGVVQHWDSSILYSNLLAADDRMQFWVIFALFFPAVTGFTQGVNMSGDLQNPEHSLPLGTFSAVFLSIIIYLLATVGFAGSLSKTTLINTSNPMTQVAVYQPIIIAGVFAATLSSALASFLGAPRILQSLANDRLWKILLPFGKGAGSTNNPRRGVILSATIALITVFMGQLNVIAPVVSMFFLISYGLINFATYFEETAESPSFRPTFRWFNKKLSLLGCLLCLTAMLAINIMAACIALSVLIAIYYYLRSTGMRSRWADGWRSFYLFRVREHLLAAYTEPDHPRDWRPNILLFPIYSPSSQQLYRFASLLEAQSGLTTVVKIVPGVTGTLLTRRKQQEEHDLRQEIQQQGLTAFPLILTTTSIDTSIETLIQAYGIGPLKANTILLPWPINNFKHPIPPSHSYAHHLRTALKLQCNLLILSDPPLEPIKKQANNKDRKRVDIWWSGGNSSHLALLLAYLLRHNPEWEECELRLLCVSEPDNEKNIQYLEQHLIEIRIPAKIKQLAVLSHHTLIAESADADIVFLPFRLKQDQLLSINGEPLDKLISGLPITALILAKQDFDLDIEPEKGLAAELAELQDILDDTKDMYAYFQQKLEKLEQEKALLLEIENSADNASKSANIEQQITHFKRRLAKAKAKLLLAEQDITEL